MLDGICNSLVRLLIWDEKDVVVSKVQINASCALEFKPFLSNSDMESFMMV